jgi:hypothetical protein
MKPMPLTILTAIAAVASLAACTPTADTLTGKVIGISDGDSIKILVNKEKQGQALRLVSLRNAIIALVAPEVGCQEFMSLIESDF